MKRNHLSVIVILLLISFTLGGVFGYFISPPQSRTPSTKDTSLKKSSKKTDTTNGDEVAVTEKEDHWRDQITIVTRPAKFLEDMTVSSGGYTAKVRRGDKYIREGAREAPAYEETLFIVSPENKYLLVNKIKPTTVARGSFSDLMLSPDGKYLFYNVFYYEFQDSHIVDTDTAGKLLPENIIVGQNESGEPLVEWSESGNRLALASYFYAFSGDGSNAVYASATGDPRDLEPIFRYPEFPERFKGEKTYKNIRRMLGIAVSDEVVLITVEDENENTLVYQYTFATNTTKLISKN